MHPRGKVVAVSTRVNDLLDQMTLEEQVRLLTGRNLWHTCDIERLGIPRLRVSDGPAGIRGTMFEGPASLNVPCSTALGASWDPRLVREIGELLGRELEAKGARVHLAPTVNLHRTPVGGRNFECMSEDPLLTALLAVEYVKGVQSQGLASCIKHFVGNDTEFERRTIDSRIDTRTLREMYLVPFERAVLDAGVLSLMTSYNRINGPHADMNADLLAGVLRGEWGFDGAVISDWFGTNSTVESTLAGLDLEMPGPSQLRGDALIAAVERGDVSAEIIRERAGNVLRLLERTGGLDSPPGPEIARDDEADLALVRRAASAGMVLLKNDAADGAPALPLDIARIRRLAVIGPNAADATIMGGGSAHVTPTRISQPLEALRSRLAPLGVEVVHEKGCDIHRKVPALSVHLVRDARAEFFASPAELDDPSATPADTRDIDRFHIHWFTDPLRRRETSPSYGVRMSMTFVPNASGEWIFGIESVGNARVIVDGSVVVDNAEAARGGSFFGGGSYEMRGTIDLVAGSEHALVVEVRHQPTNLGLGGVNIGVQAPRHGDMVADAAALAAECDAALVIVGTNDDWESEGWDRDDTSLPGRQDELISRVAAACPVTIVAINAGSPVAMPWLDEVGSVLVTWFAGQEMGDALADVVLGEVEPSGRLPVTIPHRIEDTPAFAHHPGRDGVAPYAEGRLVGYRWYDTGGPDPLFPFGFGLGYADVRVTDAATSGTHSVTTVLSNSSRRRGVQVVQVYAHLVDRAGLAPDEPDQRLVGWARVSVPAGGTVNALVSLDRDAYRAWDTETGAWTSWTGDVELRVGTSSRHIDHRLTITLP